MSIRPPRRWSPALPAFLFSVSAVPLAAQTTGASFTPAQLRTEYLTNMKEVEDKVVGLAEAFPAEKYTWRPGAGVRSVSEVLMHIASEHYVYLPRSVGASPPADLNMGTGRELVGNLEKVTNKDDVIRHVKASFAYQRKVLEGADSALGSGKVRVFGQEQPVVKLFNLFIADQHEHLGQLIAYARVNAIVPPWSKKSS
jgi:uncharacterized damage-inducible protein DinB